MADSWKHGIIGALVGVSIYGVYKYMKNEKPTLFGVLASLVAGDLAGLAPDILEPATNPNHRSIFHSISLLLVLCYANQKAWQSQKLTEEQKLAISMLSASYGSHLLVDSASPKGLPSLL